MDCLEQVKQALLTVSDKVYHYEAMKERGNYIVWAEDGGGAQLNADNSIQQQAIQGTIDYFTREESDSLVDEIQKALKNAKISFSLNSVQYEDETKYIHYEWVFEVS